MALDVSVARETMSSVKAPDQTGEDYYRRMAAGADSMIGRLGDSREEVLRKLWRGHKSLPEEELERWQRRQAEKRQRALVEARRIPPAVRDEVLSSNGGRCVYCGGWAEVVDHVIPVARGGTRRRRNLAPACSPCNLEKLESTPQEWQAWRLREGLQWPPEPREAGLMRIIQQAREMAG